MIENFLKFPQAREFLSDYPRSKWSICIDSVFLYGLISIQRDFESALSIPELLQISGLNLIPYDYGSPRNSLKPSSNYKSRTTDEETQTNELNLKRLQSPKTNEKFTLRNSTSQTTILSQSERKKSNEDLLKRSNFYSEDYRVSTDVLEPKTCPIENAQSILKFTLDKSLAKKSQRSTGKKEFPEISLDNEFFTKHLSVKIPAYLRNHKVPLNNPRD